MMIAARRSGERVSVSSSLGQFVREIGIGEG